MGQSNLVRKQESGKTWPLGLTGRTRTFHTPNCVSTQWGIPRTSYISLAHQRSGVLPCIREPLEPPQNRSEMSRWSQWTLCWTTDSLILGPDILWRWLSRWSRCHTSLKCKRKNDCCWRVPNIFPPSNYNFSPLAFETKLVVNSSLLWTVVLFLSQMTFENLPLSFSVFLFLLSASI